MNWTELNQNFDPKKDVIVCRKGTDFVMIAIKNGTDWIGDDMTWSAMYGEENPPTHYCEIIFPK